MQQVFIEMMSEQFGSTIHDIEDVLKTTVKTLNLADINFLSELGTYDTVKDINLKRSGTNITILVIIDE